MKIAKKLAGLSVVALLSIATEAKATILYTDSTEVSGALQYSSGVIDAVASGEFPAYVSGFAFVLASGTYDDIGFDAPLGQDGAGTTTMSIYSNSSNNLPQSALATTTIAPIMSQASGSLYTGSFSGLTLSGGVTYYLVIATTATQIQWLGTPTSSTGNYYFGSKSTGSTTWTKETNLNLGAFDITGQAPVATPEPETIGEMSIGLAALIFSRKRWARWI